MIHSLLAVALATVPVLAQTQSTNDLIQQAITAHELGDYAQSEAIWRQIIQLEPNNAFAYKGLGQTLGIQSQYPAALVAFQESMIQLDPNNIRAHRGLGNALKAQGKTDEAAAAFEAARRLEAEPPAP